MINGTSLTNIESSEKRPAYILTVTRSALSNGPLPRSGRPVAPDGGLIYHVLNRANARMTIFEKEADYEAFETVLDEAVARTETRLLAYCPTIGIWWSGLRRTANCHVLRGG